MDNLFTRVPLLRKLREIEIGACGTTRRHPEFPLFLIDLREHCSKQLEWNTTAAIIARKQVKIKKEDDESEWESDSEDPGVICYAWQDNNTVIACSTVHSSGNEHTIIRLRRRPQATSTNGSLVRKVFGDQVRKELPIPAFIDDYNHFMGGVDIADQLRSYYTTQRISLRNWYPLFFWILDTAILNAYLLGRQLYGDGYMAHKDFRAALWTSLFAYSKQVLTQRKVDQFYQLYPQVDLPVDLQVEHRLISSEKKVRCLNCQIICSNATKKRKFGDEVSINRVPKRTTFICSVCNVPLCKESNCWADYHRAIAMKP
jgi:hypothetical protein